MMGVPEMRDIFKLFL